MTGRLSIRLRLTALNGGVVAAILVGLGIAVYWREAHTLLERIDAALDFEYEEIAEELKHGQFAETIADLPSAFRESYLLRISKPRGRIRLESRRLSGTRLPDQPRPGAQERTQARTVWLHHRGPYRMVTGVVVGRNGMEIVQILTSLREYERELDELRAALWASLPAGLLAAVAAGYGLAGRALSPIQRMTESARRISGENLHERIEVANPGDELGQLATTINAMLDRLDVTFAAMLQFTADASHELKTPLASIRAEAELALRAPRSPEQYAEVLESVVEEVDRLAKLADHLLLLSREDAGGTSEIRYVVRVDEIAREAAEHAGPLARKAGIELRLDELPGVAVEADHDRLRRVFDNLIDNAIKYNHPGGSVIVRGVADDGRVVFEVADTGLGIPADALGRVFDRFYRVDPSRSRRTGGTGLGLSIAKTLVEGLHGRIEVESTVGVGSTFRVMLPLAKRA